MNLRLWTALGMVTVGVQSALAQVVTFTSYPFDPNHQGIVAQGKNPVGDPNPNADYTVVFASQFTAGVGGTLSSVRLPLRKNSGTDPLEVSLRADAADLPGASLKSWSTSAGAAWQDNTLTNADPGVVLAAGTKYWVVLSAGYDAVYMWGRSTQGGLMRTAFQSGSDPAWHAGNTDVFPTYEVHVTPVPEPATMTLLLAGLAVARRRRSPAR